MSERACPCLHTTPCHPDCTCANPFSSRGCERCCTYGSPDQQQAKAEYLARMARERDVLLFAVANIIAGVALREERELFLRAIVCDCYGFPSEDRRRLVGGPSVPAIKPASTPEKETPR